MKIETDGIVPTPCRETYPCVGVNTDGLVVLFHAACCGTVLIAGDDYPCGLYSDDWDMGNFRTTTDVTLTIDFGYGE